MNQFSFGKLGGRAGLVLAAVGLLAIGMGWNGAAGQLSTLAQVPYLLSGGLIGLSLVILGAAMLIVQSAREDRARLELKLDGVIDTLLEISGPAAGKPAPADLSGLVVAGSASYHVPGCRLVDGREETDFLTPAEARARQLKACRVCQPDSAGKDLTIR
ncbi:MAG: hypothetical protein JWN57_989 [Frankiales bacterium]|jgi:hypothetical protein|nr:hypothetical protein [Frankiales bacterium]